MYPRRYFTAIVIISAIIFFGREASADVVSPDIRSVAACTKAPDEEKFKIEFKSEDEMTKIYVCSIIDGESIYGGDCYYSLEPIMLHVKSDLNKDGLQDVITRNYMRGYDMDDIQAYQGFVNCGNDVYLRFTVGFFSEIIQLKRKKNQRWPDFRVTRKCDNRDENHPRLQTRTFTIKFDEKNFKYGPPNNDPELMDFCSEKELSLPFESERDL